MKIMVRKIKTKQRKETFRKKNLRTEKCQEENFQLIDSHETGTITVKKSSTFFAVKKVFIKCN